MEKINATEVKKDLYKSKFNALFSHYALGNLYYNVELLGSEIAGTYQFPISVIETAALDKDLYIENEAWDDTNEPKYVPFFKQVFVKINDDEYDYIKEQKLSADLGATCFYYEIKASELNRWIAKAIEAGTFIKIK